MPKIITPQLAPVPSDPPEVITLQRKVAFAIQSICQQVNAAVFTKDPAPDDLDMGHHRIANVKDPSSEKDAVNLGFLKRSFKGGSQPPKATGGGAGHFQVVFGTPGDISTGTLVDFPYNVGMDRAGNLVEANISAMSAPVGQDINVNFIVLTGTGTSITTSTLLASDLVLPAGQTWMAVANNFAVASLQYKDIVLLNVTQVGSTDPGTQVSIGLVVRPSG